MSCGIIIFHNTKNLMVPGCQNRYKNSFTYHCLEDDQNLQLADAVQFLEQCEKDKARVPVHCMSGRSKELNLVVYQQLQKYEQKIFGSLENQPAPAMPVYSSPEPSFSFNYSKPSDSVQAPAFNSSGATSIFACPAFDIPPQGFTFGAAHNQRNVFRDLFE